MGRSYVKKMSILTTFLTVLVSAECWPAIAQQSSKLCVPAPSLSVGNIPRDVCSLNPVNPDNQMDAFANMAWQTFKMLLWPAALHGHFGYPVRGKPDADRDLRDVSTPRVFETYKAFWEVFLPNATKPLPWAEYPSFALPCKNHPQIAPGTLVLASLNEFGNLIEPELRALGSLQSKDDKLRVAMHVLAAQNHTLVHYLAAFNQSEFDLIRRNKLYDSSNVPHRGEGPPDHATTAPDGSGDIVGAMTIKSAWIEITPSTLNPEQYYRRMAWVQNPWTYECHQAEVGLVGLHIAHKTPTRPQWIWATFEHVHNVPSSGEQQRTTFNDGSGNPMPADPPMQRPYDLRAPLPEGFLPFPTNVERVQPIHEQIATINQLWQQQLGTANPVWANYELVLVQWPWAENEAGSNAMEALPSPPCNYQPDLNFVNSVMETFLQHRDLSCGSQLITCMGCHGRTRTTDFVWSLPLNYNTARSPFIAETNNRLDALRVLEDITGPSAR